MKKIIAFILSVVILGTCVPPAFAIEEPLAQTGDAQIAPSWDKSSYTNTSEVDNIKMTEDGDYALEICENTESVYIPVGRMDIDILDDDEFNSAMQNTLLSDHIKHSLTVHREMLLNSGKESYSATVFSPELLTQARSIVIDYPEYKGHRMRNEVISYSSLEKTYTANGTKSKDIADTLSTIFLTGTSFSSVPAISLCSAGLSLFGYFLSVYENSFPVGGTSDFVTVTVKYDKIDQFTCTDVLGEWMVGLTSQYVKVRDINTHQYYYDANTNKGRSLDHKESPNFEAETPNYEEPLAFAFQHMNDGVTEYITLEIGSKKFVF